MNPQFYLGLIIGVLTFPLGLTIGFNRGVDSIGELKKFNEKKYHLLKGVLDVERTRDGNS